MINILRKILSLLLIISSFLISKSQEKFTENEKNLLLSEHNYYREVVGAKPLIWSNELEEKASEFAFDIANNPNTYSKNNNYGSNIFRSIEKPNPFEIVKYWADEQKYYQGEELNQFNIYKFQHYTQIIWKQTVSVGCAIDKTKGEIFTVVCLYSPKGNSLGTKP